MVGLFTPCCTSNSRRDLISIFDPKLNYLQFIYTLLDIERIISPNLKVKYDALYSTSRGYLDEVLQHSLWRSVRKFPRLAKKCAKPMY
jgi:phosphoglucomutase